MANPLYNHVGPKINVIFEEEGFAVQRDIQKVKTPMIDVFKTLTLAKIIPSKKEEEKVKGKKGCFCPFH